MRQKAGGETAEMKRDKKLLAKEIEGQIDREFEKRGINLRVYYFRDVPPFNAVTVATAIPFRWENLASIIHPPFPHLFNPATYLLQNLAAVHDLHGVAICGGGDTFSRQEGRCRAKRRLLRHIKGRG